MALELLPEGTASADLLSSLGLCQVSQGDLQASPSSSSKCSCHWTPAACA
jgi:hypothetical protein